MDAGLAGLALGAFLAATLLPFSSEAMLAGMMLSGGYDAWMLWGAAWAGNVAGSAVNWALGRWMGHWRGHPRFPFGEAWLGRAEGWFRRYGGVSLLLAWVPLLGDPLTFVAGVLRMGWVPFLGWVMLGKGARYAAVVWAVGGG
ncbi:MAG: DedA family protein [Magnetococcales bacterium]|nr:DedA family protein [Magnetococcales bacterium]